MLKQVEHRQIPRSFIQEAAYNPRRISDASRKKLAAKMHEVGCVQPLVWNERTGNLVSGHQRLSIMDEADGSRSYHLGVSVVDLDPKDEKALNVLLNNPHAHGEFSRELLIEFLRDSERPTLRSLGYDRLELEMEVGALKELDGILAEEEAATAPILEELQKIEDLKRAKKLHLQESQQSPDVESEYMVAVVFDSVEEKRRQLELLGMPATAEHVKFAAIRHLIAQERIPPLAEDDGNSNDEPADSTTDV